MINQEIAVRHNDRFLFATLMAFIVGYFLFWLVEAATIPDLEEQADPTHMR